MRGQTIHNTPRRYCEYNNGRISRTYLDRTRENPQHHIRTDRIGSRYEEWRRKDALDLQCSTRHTKEVTRDREDQLWATNPRNPRANDPMANIVGWYSGHIDPTDWIERHIRCYRRIRPAAEQRSRKKHSPLYVAYQKAKAEREAEEGESANILTQQEQKKLKDYVTEASLLALADANKAEDKAAKQKEEREGELKSILASLAAVVPTIPATERSQITTPILQMHPDRMAQLDPPAAYQLDASTVKHVESQVELKRRKELKARRAKAKLEGRPFEEDESEVEDPRGMWQAPEYALA